MIKFTSSYKRTLHRHLYILKLYDPVPNRLVRHHCVATVSRRGIGSYMIQYLVGLFDTTLWPLSVAERFTSAAEIPLKMIIDVSFVVVTMSSFLHGLSQNMFCHWIVIVGNTTADTSAYLSEGYCCYFFCLFFIFCFCVEFLDHCLPFVLFLCVIVLPLLLRYTVLERHIRYIQTFLMKI